MIDIHTHCLPYIDDGAHDIDESISMIKDCALQGVTLCVATPHCVIHSASDVKKFLTARDDVYNKVICELEKQNVLYPKICCGAEVFLDNDVSKYSDIFDLCISGSNCLLVEIPNKHIHNRVIEWIYNLTLKGITPIIAHIDRYLNWEEIVHDLQGMKVIYQVNAYRFLTINGGCIIKRLLKHVDKIVVGSDMHNMKIRPCYMGKAYHKSLKKFGDITRSYFYDNSKEILNNCMIEELK